jgi:hypothetical protein
VKYCIYYTQDESGFVTPGIVGKPGFIYFNNPPMNENSKIRLFTRAEAEEYISEHHKNAVMLKHIHICPANEVRLIWAEHKLKNTSK